MVKSLALAAAVLVLAGCNRGIENKEAVRQAVVDYLANRKNLNIGSMNVDVTSVTFKENQAEAMVSFSPKGGGGASQGMSMRYTLEKKGNRWAVKSRADSGQNPHGDAMGGSMGEMPRPSELPRGHPPMSGAPKNGKK